MRACHHCLEIFFMMRRVSNLYSKSRHLYGLNLPLKNRKDSDTSDTTVVGREGTGLKKNNHSANRIEGSCRNKRAENHHA